MHVSQNWSEADIIDQIVEDILFQKSPKILFVAKYPVGLDSHIRHITTLLSTDTKCVIRFGIYGMGGVGKTTLAKALYNRLLLRSFKNSCFLANCSEVWRTKGLEYLQQKLINDVLQSKNKVMVDNADNGIQLIRERICSKKLLVVIDDLDQYLNIEYLIGLSNRPIFAPGSIIIITTRFYDLLKNFNVEPKYQYKVNELDEVHSQSLFKKHAFGNGNAETSSTLMVLVKEILCHAGGLPLALKVFGSYLYKRPEAGWKYFINKLGRFPDATIQKRLIISLEALESDDPMLKNMFLDIACFLIGSVKERAVKLLETYYSDADYRISILKKRCLLDIDDSNKLKMHDLLRDMGREVSRNNSLNDPGKHSRLWKVEDICEVLMRQKGTEVIEGIIPWNQKSMEKISFTAKTFERLSNLRFLSLNDVNITGTFNQTMEDLRWLSWYQCPLESFPSEFYARKLVFLALPASKLRTMKLDMVFKNLKNLDMSGSRHLTTLPDFIQLPCLETLNLTECEELKCLPDSLCNLTALEILHIYGCLGLEALPVELGNIKSLKKLEAGSLKVLKLPESIGGLYNLVELFLSSNPKLETLPDTICNLKALEVLDISRCSNLRALPVKLGKMESLKELCMSHLNVSEIPDSISDLHELAILDLACCENLRNLPDSIGSLRSLEEHRKNQERIPIKYWDISKERKQGVYL